MSSSLVVCEVDESLKAKLKKFRFRKETNNAAILMKIDMEKQLVILEEEYEDISVEELREELPERQPRFIVYSYKYVHDDKRVSYPLCFIFCSPMGCKPEQQMMYAGSKNYLVQAAELTKVLSQKQWLIFNHILSRVCICLCVCVCIYIYIYIYI
uniref:ADF-H domain-containing protein n=1 Tax=Sphaeramia orbicularis TaxID=375764 RepID=A0A672ZL05_9TELE